MVKAGGGNTAVNDHLQQVTSEFQHIAAIFCSQGPEVLLAFPDAFPHILVLAVAGEGAPPVKKGGSRILISCSKIWKILSTVGSTSLPNSCINACSSRMNHFQEAARAMWQRCRRTSTNDVCGSLFLSHTCGVLNIEISLVIMICSVLQDLPDQSVADCNQRCGNPVSKIVSKGYRSGSQLDLSLLPATHLNSRCSLAIFRACFPLCKVQDHGSARCKTMEAQEGRKFTHPWQPTRLNGWYSMCSSSA